MIVLDGRDTRACLPMPAAIDAAREAMRSFSSGAVVQPMRTVLDGGPAGLFGAMPVGVQDGNRMLFGVKTVTVKHDNGTRGLPSHNGLVLVFDEETGLPVAVVDAAAVTEIRTAAVSAVATDLLAVRPAATLAILGTGAQARAHLQAVGVVRPGLAVTVWGRNPDRAVDFAEWAMDRLGVPVALAGSVRRATAEADIICTVTGIRTPLISLADIRPGAHVNAVGASLPGARELAGDLIAAATVVVDSREAAGREADDLIVCVDPPRRAVIHAELGEILLGSAPGRTDPAQTTVYKSVGLGVQDLFAARAAAVQAAKLGIGQHITMRI